jgi:glycerol-3-phosphate dehydrogenase
VKRNVQAFREDSFDLLVVGGGITGAGVALDSVLNGWRTGLIDKADFASGTSSASSKLVHGGLRYLEHGEFRLVYEALHERRRLLHNACHLVAPLRFIVPFYKQARVSPWQWRAALTAYDLLAGASNIRRSRRIPLEQLREECPALRTAGLMGGAEYFDAQMDDARLCLDVVQTAARNGAAVANYVEAVGFEASLGKINGVRVRDHVGGDEFTIRAHQVLNAAGPGVDTVCRLAGDESGPHLQPTKGVHLIAGPRSLAAAFLLLHPADGRVFFVIPWSGGVRYAADRGHTKTLIGTTDTLWQGNDDSLAVLPEDVTYLLQGFNHYFTPPLDPRDVLGTFAGLRPLIRSKPGDPSSLSREFRLFESPSGLLSAAGGKYTTYRRMAEVIAEAVGRKLKRRHQRLTRDFRLDGTPDAPWDDFVTEAARSMEERFGLDAGSVHHLLSRYGKRAEQVAAHIERDPALSRAVIPGEPDLRAEFAYQRDEEMAIYPEDSLLRRTRLGLFHPELLKPTVFPEARR